MLRDLKLPRASWCLLVLLPGLLHAQVLNLPPRPTGAPTGTQFTNIVSTLSREEREQWVYAQVLSGNVPAWWRTLAPISVSAAGHTATYHVTPDYLAIGSDTDYVLQPMTPLLAQRLCDHLGCTLPTRRMVNQIWSHAPVKLSPAPIAPSPEMVTVPVFAQHNTLVRAQRDALTDAHPLGTLVGGHKKDVILSTRIYTNFAQASVTRPVVIYGWHQTNGTPIQPLYNGHGETYADYSHGIRLVQMTLTVDGQPDTITNVLAHPTLAALLSDDGPAEGSPDGTIPVPRYPVPPLAPVVMVPPHDRSAAPGAVVTLQVLALGDPPLSFQWRLNNTNLPAATSAVYTITDLNAANAGSYSVAVSNPAGTATSRTAVVRANPFAFPTLFHDDFASDTTTNWAVVWDAANGIADYAVDFAFDHGAVPYTHLGMTRLIPPAPNTPDDSTRSVRLAVNQDALGTTAAVNLYPRDLVLAGDFSLKFDLWIQYPGDALGLNATGSTQHALCGMNHRGTHVNWTATSTQASDGFWFAVSGEGGDSRDYRALVGNLQGPPLDLTGSPASGLIGTNHTAPAFQNLFPSPRFETAGAPGKHWVEVELCQTNQHLIWLLNGTVVASRTNTSAFTNGTLMLGLMDVFPSIANPARDSFVLFDNVRVENLSPPIRFESIRHHANGTVTLELSSAPDRDLWLDSSPDLTHWQPLAHLLATNPPTIFTDTLATGSILRFYRARH